MNKNLKISAVVGFILYAIAAFFCISLLFVLFDFCGLETARFSALWRFGKLFTGVYGICSVLIPLFLLVAELVEASNRPESYLSDRTMRKPMMS